MRRLGGLLATLALALPALLIAQPAAAAPATQPVRVTLASVTPRTPAAAVPQQPVVFVATLTNTGNTTYADVQVGLQRGLPITQQNLLDTAIATPPATDFSVPAPLDLHRGLLPHASLTVRYRTTSGDMCLCYGGVYPYALVVSASTPADPALVEVGRVQVFVPSFLQAPQPVRVSWVWPLLDKPHRSTDNDVFTDESLAGEVGPGGRLDRALNVVERVAGKVRLSVVTDPDLLDSLAVMAQPAGYRVRKGSGTVAGTGGRLAADWLARFRQVAAKNDVVLTGFADPDVNALSRAGLSFSTALDPQVQSRIAPYLESTASAQSMLAWPAGQALTSRALDSLVGAGTSTVLLSDTALPGGNKTEPRPDALSPLPTVAGTARALVTDSAIQETVGRMFKRGARAANDQQTLLAQLAVRAEQDPAKSHYVVIAPDRYVDADPATAAATILSVVGTGWSSLISVPQALATVTPADRGALDTTAESADAEVSQSQLAAVNTVGGQVSSISDALGSNDAAATLLAGFSTGILRAESSAWRSDRAGGGDAVRQLQARIGGLIGAVHLVRPAVGTYSLTSTTAPLVVTVANELSRPVTVQVVITPVRPGIGFTTAPATAVTVPASSIQTVRIPAKVERLGKFQVVATLQTPDGQRLGQDVQLSLRATAIGTVAKIITIGAVAVLLLALLRRLVGRIRHGRRPAPDPAPGGPGLSPAVGS